VAEWVEAYERRDALNTELSEPTASRHYEAQTTLSYRRLKPLGQMPTIYW
jgi:hypothetical protein